MTTGTVIACCAREQRGMPKYPRDEIDVGTYGVDGDYHAGPISTHGSSAESRTTGKSASYPRKSTTS